MLITASDKLLLVLFAAILAAAQLLQFFFNYGRGWDSGFRQYTDFRTFSGFWLNLLFNGFHPVLPWIGFFLFGMWAGRRPWLARACRAKLLICSVSGVIGIETSSYALIRWSAPILDKESAVYLFGTKPMSPTLLYVLSGICTALAVIAISLYIRWANAKWNHAFIYTGQLSLTHYLGHVIIGLGLLEALGYLENGSLPFAVAYSCGYSIIAIILSYVWRRRVKRVPVELLLRKLS
ncbi:DUF418 domain-containing protein [Paenibacillus thiaminolyticus]|uniref:DUF418 domain-containing protein n=1 Tax=Paenibacillus thiaminolyticus TaxID=49283 RepID=UPI0035A64741